MMTMKLKLMEWTLFSSQSFHWRVKYSADPNAAEEGSENYENANELTPEIVESL